MDATEGEPKSPAREPSPLRTLEATLLSGGDRPAALEALVAWSVQSARVDQDAVTAGAPGGSPEEELCLQASQQVIGLLIDACQLENWGDLFVIAKALNKLGSLLKIVAPLLYPLQAAIVDTLAVFRRCYSTTPGKVVIPTAGAQDKAEALQLCLIPYMLCDTMQALLTQSSELSSASADMLLGFAGFSRALLEAATSFGVYDAADAPDSPTDANMRSVIRFAALQSKRGAAELLATLLEHASSGVRKDNEFELVNAPMASWLVEALAYGRPDVKLHGVLFELLWRGIRRIDMTHVADTFPVADELPALHHLDNIVGAGTSWNLRKMEPQSVQDHSSALQLSQSKDELVTLPHCLFAWDERGFTSCCAMISTYGLILQQTAESQTDEMVWEVPWACVELPDVALEKGWPLRFSIDLKVACVLGVVPIDHESIGASKPRVLLELYSGVSDCKPPMPAAALIATLRKLALVGKGVGCTGVRGSNSSNQDVNTVASVGVAHEGGARLASSCSEAGLPLGNDQLTQSPGNMSAKTRERGSPRVELPSGPLLGSQAATAQGALGVASPAISHAMCNDSGLTPKGSRVDFISNVLIERLCKPTPEKRLPTSDPQTKSDRTPHKANAGTCAAPESSSVASTTPQHKDSSVPRSTSPAANRSEESGLETPNLSRAFAPFGTLNVSRLRDACRDRGLSQGGVKADLIYRLTALAGKPADDREPCTSPCATGWTESPFASRKMQDLRALCRERSLDSSGRRKVDLVLRLEAQERLGRGSPRRDLSRIEGTSPAQRSSTPGRNAITPEPARFKEDSEPRYFLRPLESRRRTSTQQSLRSQSLPSTVCVAPTRRSLSVIKRRPPGQRPVPESASAPQRPAEPTLSRSPGDQQQIGRPETSENLLDQPAAKAGQPAPRPADVDIVRGTPRRRLRSKTPEASRQEEAVSVAIGASERVRAHGKGPDLWSHQQAMMKWKNMMQESVAYKEAAAAEKASMPGASPQQGMDKACRAAPSRRLRSKSPDVWSQPHWVEARRTVTRRRLRSKSPDVWSHRHSVEARLIVTRRRIRSKSPEIQLQHWRPTLAESMTDCARATLLQDIIEKHLIRKR